MSYDSSTSTTVSSQAGISVAGESTSSTTYSTTLESSSPSDSDGLAAELGGEAVALGDDTLATGSLFAVAADEGDITTLNSTVAMVTASEAADGETAFASADTFTDVLGAELVFTYAQESSYQSGTGSIATATSTTTVMAYDLPDDGGNAPPGSSSFEEVASDQPGLDTSTDSDAGVDLDGNVASLEFSAVAVGDDSLVIVDAFALAVEDELSISAIYVELAVD